MSVSKMIKLLEVVEDTCSNMYPNPMDELMININPTNTKCNCFYVTFAFNPMFGEVLVEFDRVIHFGIHATDFHDIFQSYHPDKIGFNFSKGDYEKVKSILDLKRM